LAKADLAESTARLTTAETAVGGDLAELRAMQESGAGESALRRNAEDIRNQLRETKITGKARAELLDVLHAAGNDPGRLIAAPNSLLESQPALKRLKDGLVDAQLATAKLLGARSAEHPLVQAARQAEEEVGHHLHEELALAVRGMEIELRLNADRQKLLEDQLAATEERLQRLAEIRAAYETQTAETRNRAGLAARAEQNLAEARSVLAGAKVASLISRIDEPDTGAKPVGPSRAIIALGGILGGLIIGLGLVFLSLPVAHAPRNINAEQDMTAAANRSAAFTAQSTTEKTNGNGHLTFKKALEKIHVNGIF
jgi:polysaccharide biosynthesis transport protein